MFRRKTIRIQRPPEGFTPRHGNGAAINPWSKIEQLAASRDRMKDALSALHKQLEEAYLKEIRAYLAGYGVRNRRSPYFGEMPRREHEGAIYIELPEGWAWEHRADTGWLEPWQAARSTVLYLVAPNGADLAAVDSHGFQDLVNQPFATKDIYAACAYALTKVLPPHIDDKPVPLGTLGGGE